MPEKLNLACEMPVCFCLHSVQVVLGHGFDGHAFYTDVILFSEGIDSAADGWIHEFERFVPE